MACHAHRNVQPHRHAQLHAWLEESFESQIREQHPQIEPARVRAAARDMAARHIGSCPAAEQPEDGV